MEVSGEALMASLQAIKVIYETALNYRNFGLINQKYLNEICLLITLKDHIMKSRRMVGNEMIENYLKQISTNIHKLKDKIDKAESLSFLRKLQYIRGINHLAEDTGKMIKQLKFILEIKRELDSSSKTDISNIIADDKAREFWEQNFGSDQLFIQTNMFFSALRLNTDLLNNEIDFLKKIINDDGDKYISAFEFQEWLDFFGDFSVCMRRTINSLINPDTQEPYEWYQKNMNKNLVKSVLSDQLFIVRKHTTQRGIFIVSYTNTEDGISNIYIRNANNRFQLEEMPNMKPIDRKMYDQLTVKTADILIDFIREIAKILGDDENSYKDWSNERKSLADSPAQLRQQQQDTGFMGSMRDKLPEPPGFLSFCGCISRK